MFLLVSLLGLSAVLGATSDTSPAPCSPYASELQELKDKLQGDMYFPDSKGYDTFSMVRNFLYWTPGSVSVVVVPNTTEDVRETMKLLHKYKLSPTIQSSGHDFIGRNTAAGSIHINLVRMQDVVIDTNDQDSDTGASAWIQPGNSWKRVYEEVDKHKKLVVGGSAHTVAPGGYLLGGGHSPMTPTLGLGVDSVLAITAVMADGSVVNVTESSISIEHPDGRREEKADSDLFWALRGGGGSTFAVATNFKVKLHEPPEDGFVRMLIGYPLSLSVDPTAAKQVLDFFSDYFVTNMSKAGWGGYILISNERIVFNESDPNSEYTNGSITFALLHRGGLEKAWPSAEPLYNFKQEYQGYRVLESYATFWEYEKAVTDTEGYYQTYIFNRFLQRSDFAETPEKISEAMYDMLSAPIAMTCTGATLGGKALEPSVDSASIGPDFRSAWQSLTCGAGWGERELDDVNVETMQKYAKIFYSKVGKGVYYNEPDYKLDNWKIDYWGTMERYNRLLEIKRKWDPDFLFQCHHCVGSDIIKPVGCVSSSNRNMATISAMMLLVGIWAIMSN